MNKDFNRFTKSDLPLDNSLNFSSTPSKLKVPTKKKITALGKNSLSKNSISNMKESIAENQKLRRKLAKDKVDFKELDKVNEENFRTNRFRSSRNKAIIIILIILILLMIGFISVYSFILRLKPNCFVYVHGNGTAYVGGKELKRFRAPADIQGYRIYEFDLDVGITDNREHSIEFEILCYQNGVLMTNTPTFYDYSMRDGQVVKDSEFYLNGNRNKSNRMFTSADGIINLCDGVAIDKMYESTLNDNNFIMEIHIYIS